MTHDEAETIPIGADVFIVKGVRRDWYPIIERAKWQGLKPPINQWAAWRALVKDRCRWTTDFDLEDVHITDESARAQVTACAKKHRAKLRRDLKRMETFDAATLRIRK